MVLSSPLPSFKSQFRLSLSFFYKSYFLHQETNRYLAITVRHDMVLQSSYLDTQEGDNCSSMPPYPVDATHQSQPYNPPFPSSFHAYNCRKLFTAAAISDVAFSQAIDDITSRYQYDALGAPYPPAEQLRLNTLANEVKSSASQLYNALRMARSTDLSQDHSSQCEYCSQASMCCTWR